MGMLIKIKGQRSFQVSRSEVLSDCRGTKDIHTKIGYLDPGFEYEVKDVFGEKMCRVYPNDIEKSGQATRYVAPKVAEQPKPEPVKVAAPAAVKVSAPAPKVEAPKSKNGKRR